jgi:hypothetical protein
MKVHEDAQRVMDWLADNQPATIAQITAAGMMTARAASNAIDYATSNRAIEPIQSHGQRVSERFDYRLTGRPLPTRPGLKSPLSFDALLVAWGIALNPPSLPRTPWPRSTQND